MIFNVPSVDDFCRIIRNGISACGGPEGFFRNLTDETRETLRKVSPDFATQRTLRQLLDDTAYQAIFVEHIGSTDDKEFVQGFLQGWRVWSESFPTEAEEVKLILIPSGEILFNESVPRITNDIYACMSVLSLDAYHETFMVRTVMKLASSNKQIGGNHAFLMSVTLPSFLDTIRIMLNSTKLQGTEVGMFKMAEGRNTIIEEIVSLLEQIQNSIVEVRNQFKSMK